MPQPQRVDPATLYDHALLRTWRDESGLTLTQAAYHGGISASWLRDLEKGLAVPSLQLLAALCDLYRHQLAELFPRELERSA